MAPTESHSSAADPLDFLALLSSGGITVTVAGYPLLSIDSQDKEVHLEIQGAREAGLKLSDIIKLEQGDSNILRGSESIAGKLAHLGWRLILYDKGDRVVALGSGVSRLTGHVSLNPLMLKRLLDALK